MQPWKSRPNVKNRFVSMKVSWVGPLDFYAALHQRDSLLPREQLTKQVLLSNEIRIRQVLKECL